jgi:outer membrane biosynthesis protein TonB
MWTPILLILGLVGAIILVVVLVGKEPPHEDDRQPGATPLDRFLAEARGERTTRAEKAAETRAIPTARPRPRPQSQPRSQPRAIPQPQPRPEPIPVLVPLPEPPPPVVIRHAPMPVAQPIPEPVRIPRPESPSRASREKPPARETLRDLLHDRNSVRAAFLLSEILQAPRCRRPHQG